MWRVFRSGPSWGRIAFFGGYILLLTLLLPRTHNIQYNYQVGKTWKDKDLIAPLEFGVYKSSDELQKDIDSALSQVFPVYLYDSAAYFEGVNLAKLNLDDFFKQTEAYRSALQKRDTTTAGLLVRTIFKSNFPDISLNQLPFPNQYNALRENLDRKAMLVEEKGYLNLTWQDDHVPDYLSLRILPGLEKLVATEKLLFDSTDLEVFLATKANPNLPKGTNELVDAVMVRNLTASFRYNEEMTSQARSAMREQVSPLKGLITKNTRIIGRNQIVSKENAAAIESLAIELENVYGETHFWNVLLSRFILVVMISLLLIMYLRANRPQIYESYVKTSLILFTFLLVVCAQVFASRLGDLGDRFMTFLNPALNLPYIYLAPACIIPIFISNFFGPRTGYISNIVISLYGGVLIDQSVEYVFVQLMAGSIAVYSLRRLRSREMFFYSLGFIFLTYAVSYLGFNLLMKGSFYELKYSVLLLLGVNVTITIIAYNLIYLLEQMFGVTSDLTYLELLDMNHPLMKELSKKAPGTFQHSLQVANIAEATINEIGGNALLVHVGALYHDIGKIATPKYFIENLSKEEKLENPHKGLSCTESASIIIGHVRKGVELAQKYHLPREITNFIETHHGMTRVEYFFRQHLVELNCDTAEDEAMFRYPGPLPFSKETAVVMMADSIEAASRAMKDPTPEKLNDLINTIIDHKIRDNQLENSNLTFKDIATIRKTIYRQLLSIYHGRIEYPREAVL